MQIVNVMMILKEICKQDCTIVTDDNDTDGWGKNTTSR